MLFSGPSVPPESQTGVEITVSKSATRGRISKAIPVVGSPNPLINNQFQTACQAEANQIDF